MAYVFLYTTRVKNLAKSLENSKKEFSGLKSKFYSNAYGSSVCPELSKFLNQIHARCDNLSTNLGNLQKFAEDLYEDFEAMDSNFCGSNLPFNNSRGASYPKNYRNISNYKVEDELLFTPYNIPDFGVDPVKVVTPQPPAPEPVTPDPSIGGIVGGVIGGGSVIPPITPVIEETEEVGTEDSIVDIIQKILDGTEESLSETGATIEESDTTSIVASIAGVQVSDEQIVIATGVLVAIDGGYQSIIVSFTIDDIKNLTPDQVKEMLDKYRDIYSDEIVDAMYDSIIETILPGEGTIVESYVNPIGTHLVIGVPTSNPEEISKLLDEQIKDVIGEGKWTEAEYTFDIEITGVSEMRENHAINKPGDPTRFPSPPDGTFDIGEPIESIAQTFGA